MPSRAAVTLRMPREKVGNGALQNPHAVSVDDSNPVHFGERGAIEELIHLLASVFGALADEIDLTEGAVKARPLTEGNGWASGGSARGRQHLLNVRDRHLHPQKTGVHF